MATRRYDWAQLGADARRAAGVEAAGRDVRYRLEGEDGWREGRVLHVYARLVGGETTEEGFLLRGAYRSTFEKVPWDRLAELVVPGNADKWN